MQAYRRSLRFYNNIVKPSHWFNFQCRQFINYNKKLILSHSISKATPLTKQEVNEIFDPEFIERIATEKHNKIQLKKQRLRESQTNTRDVRSQEKIIQEEAKVNQYSYF